MNALAPFVIALIIVLLLFMSAYKNGVVMMLASGFSILAGMAVMAIGQAVLPGLIGDRVSWGPAAIVGVVFVLSVVVALIVRPILVAVFRKVMGPDSWFHWAADGVVGGVLSLIPAVAIILLLFCCLRVAGTAMEMNHVAVLSHDDSSVSSSSYPIVSKWRNTIEKVPMLASGLDLVDPLGNRASRNATSLVMVSDSGRLKGFMKRRQDIAPLVEHFDRTGPSTKAALEKALQSKFRILVNLSPTIRSHVDGFPELGALKSMQLKPGLEAFTEAASQSPSQ